METARLVLIFVVLAGVLFPVCGAAGPTSSEPIRDLFSLTSADNILEEEHFGIANGRITPGIPFKGIAGIQGLWAPPLVSSDFTFDLQLANQPVAAREYTWHPFEVERHGNVEGVSFETTTTLIYGYPALILTATLENHLRTEVSQPLTVTVSGTLDREGFWEFSRPQSKTVTQASREGDLWVLSQGPWAIVIGSNLKTLQWGSQGKANLTIQPGQREVIHFCIALGNRDDAMSWTTLLMRDPEQAVNASRREFSRRVEELFTRLPRFHSENRDLEALYNRSLVHLLMNRWEVPEFVLNPYYSTGSVKGGCVCNYLWNYGEVWEILPLYDPQAAREHIKQFLKGDLTTHFAFNPVDGQAWGPWYPVNQEKIIGSIFYYVTLTGDKSFLNEEVAGKTIFEWVQFHATVGDDVSKPVALIDYGPGNHHLELRRGFPYNHVMPDLNGRRITNYWMADALSRLAGKDSPGTVERQETLRQLLINQLWDPKAQWFAFVDDKGNRDLRYTMQIFKLIGTHVLPRGQEEGLLSHLNDSEFLSEYGFHSLSKTDIAYDQVDIDNGGGGACTCFPPQIIERLYRAGYPDKAEDILRRILWWGQKMPYWGDSIVANHPEYRKDTPLQCTLDGATVAQCIIFGLSGVSPDLEGNLHIKPQSISLSKSYDLSGLKVLGRTLEIHVEGGHFSVSEASQVWRENLGDEVILKPVE
jgi:hypothetical protein